MAVRIVSKELQNKRQFLLNGCLAVLLSIAISLSSPISFAQQQQSVDRLKPAYVYNFMKYISWPVKEAGVQSENFNLCLVANRAEAESFQPLAGRKIAGRTITNHRVSIKQPELDQCNVIYVAESQRSQLARFSELIGQNPVFIIADGPEAIGNAMIELVIVNDSLRFNIDLKGARANGLDISSYLLKLAINVHE